MILFSKIRKLIYNIKSGLIRAYYTKIAKLKLKDYKLPIHVNGKFSIPYKTVTFGKNVNINGMQIIGHGDVYIGDNFHSGSECMMITQNHNYEGETLPYDAVVIKKKINIGDNVWFGSRVLVIPGITIGEGAIIQAGAVVIKDIPPYSIAGGNPATVFKQRDIDHYTKLKAEGKFF
ncbi:MAG: acetyltransferase [Bacteroidetes bacterium GWE2_29_8]|nr:MAG: acetyltransferase [Bacteroidetes bacterium GWE2_29_8]